MEIMKPVILISAALLLSGCIYEAPLVAENKLPIDAAIIGLWEPLPQEEKEPENDGDNPLKKILEHSPAETRLLILKFSETEYLISNPVAEHSIHYRAYPIELGGKRCVQLQVIGTNEGSADWENDTPRPFLVCSHETKDGNLIVSNLNEELVGDELKTTAALQEAFLKNKDNPQLFGEPTIYRKVKAD